MGRLYVVSTPIGNLGDMTLRAIEVLRTVELIACEDTRVTKKLLDHYEIRTPTTSFHAHTEAGKRARLVERMAGGASIALVSDAGTPLLSDPGALLVKEAIEAGAEVLPIPGASALLAGLVGSGLPTHRLLFLGFLPKGASARREALAPYKEVEATLILYESPHRLRETLVALHDLLGDRSACVARELTKRFETFLRGSLSALVAQFESAPKGEVVILVGPPLAPEAAPVDLVATARSLLDGGMRPADAAKTLAGRYGITKREGYDKVMAAKSMEVTATDDDQRSLEAVVLDRLKAYAESLKGHAPENMYDLIMPQLERPLIKVAMELSGGRQVQAAEMLGIHRNTLRTRLRKLGIEEEP